MGIERRVADRPRAFGASDDAFAWGHEFRDDDERLCALVDVTIAVRPLGRSAE